MKTPGETEDLSAPEGDRLPRMKSLAILAAALIASGSAFAGQASDKDKSAHTPVLLSEAQMDNVGAGALVNAILVDVVDINNNNVQVAVPVNAAVAAGILGIAGGRCLSTAWQPDPALRCSVEESRSSSI